MRDDKLSRAEEVADHIHRAAEELVAAAESIPGCDCAVLNHERVAEVVADLCRAEVAAQAVHCGLRELERKHERGNVGLATLETQPLIDIKAHPLRPRAFEEIQGLAAEAANEMTGGQCC